FRTTKTVSPLASCSFSIVPSLAGGQPASAAGSGIDRLQRLDGGLVDLRVGAVGSPFQRGDAGAHADRLQNGTRPHLLEGVAALERAYHTWLGFGAVVAQRLDDGGLLARITQPAGEDVGRGGVLYGAEGFDDVGTEEEGRAVAEHLGELRNDL